MITYYFLVSLIVNNSKYRKLEKQKAVKKRWMELRKNAKVFQQTKGWEKPEETQPLTPEITEKIRFLTLANVILLLSNSFLLFANILVLFFLMPFEMAKSSTIDFYIRICMGIGCCLSWFNCVTLMATFKKFRVVDLVSSGCFDYQPQYSRSRSFSLRSDPTVLRFLVRRLLHVS